MKIIRQISRILVGLTFLFSGFVKGVDPLGSTYKFTDYFNAFGTEWATGLSFVLAVLQSVAEFGIGAALLLNYRTRLFSWLALIFMAFFLPLTLYIAIKNPVTDCGCFGDALIITNWETFYKNVVLTILTVVIVAGRKSYNNPLKTIYQHLMFGVSLLGFVGIIYHSYNHLPLFDFRPYNEGANIIEGMEIPDDAPVDEYRTEFVYRNLNTGEEQDFDETNYPWEDTENWEYVSSNSILVKEGYHPPIHDFTIENEYGEDVKDFYLYDPGFTFILVAYNLEKYNSKKQEQINLLAEQAMNEGMNFICLTASSRDQIDKLIEEHSIPYEFFFCDEITLKTIIRSNPGLLLTKEAEILSKWHWKDLPDFNDLDYSIE